MRILALDCSVFPVYIEFSTMNLTDLPALFYRFFFVIKAFGSVFSPTFVGKSTLAGIEATSRRL
jgi:hypothetical protein